MTSVAIVGRGQLGTAVAEILRAEGSHEVLGPFGRDDAQQGVTTGADVVVIATTTRLVDVAEHVETAVSNGSNVLVSAEEAADPWVIDPEIAERLNRLAHDRGVSICGAGVNPGLIFDSLVLTLLGTTDGNVDISVRRTVDISRFGPSVLRRIGIGLDVDEFESGVKAGTVFGHAGFPQSMSVVAKALGVAIDCIDRRLAPIVGKRDSVLDNGMPILAGQTVGVDQTYTAIVADHPWYAATFVGHTNLPEAGLTAVDVIEFRRDGGVEGTFTATPGIDAQQGSRNMVANSVSRILRARPGWLSVAELPPSVPK